MGHIFISYSHTDMEDAHVLAAQLQERGFEVWIDERLDHGSQWPHELQKQLDSCSAFIVIMRPLSYASEGCRASCNGRAARETSFSPFAGGRGGRLSVESTQYYDVRRGSWHDQAKWSRHPAAAGVRWNFSTTWSLVSAAP